MEKTIFSHLSKKAKTESAIISPGEKVSSLAIQVLEEINVDTPAPKPTKVAEEIIKETDLMLSFGYLVPYLIPRKNFESGEFIRQ